jgi:hypothetical protein
MQLGSRLWIGGLQAGKNLLAFVCIHRGFSAGGWPARQAQGLKRSGELNGY